MPPPFITRVRIKNYKSIGYCNVELQPCTFLVGPNGAGKSNFLDAIRFIADALRNSLDHAVRERGGISEVKRRLSMEPSVSIRLDFVLSDVKSGFYAIELETRSEHGRFGVREEQCSLSDGSGYRVRDGSVETFSGSIAPPATSDRLFLVHASGFPEFRPLYDGLSQMGFYSISPEQVRALQPPSLSDFLLHDGSNIASVLDQLAFRDPASKRRVERFLSQIVPGLTRADSLLIASMETVQFLQGVIGTESAALFQARSMSDGTLRALGVLVALFQFGCKPTAVPHLIGIEEPESALHPAAAGVLFDAIQDASQQIQVIITSHSPELLEDKSLAFNSILAVVSEGGEAKIGRIDQTGREILRDRLATAGELLRMGRIFPDWEELERRREQSGSFFEVTEG